MMLLQRILNDIEKLYAIGPLPNIEDYVCGCGIEADSDAGLYLEIMDDTIEAKIFFCQEILDFISECKEKELPVNGKTVAKYMATIEEVSHLAYIWTKCMDRGQHPETMTKLEMELQANIDKYILLANIFIEQTQRYPINLREIIFEKVRCKGGGKKEIYDFCDDTAMIYSSRLENLILNKRRGEFLHEVRDFYMRDHHGKLKHILQ